MPMPMMNKKRSLEEALAANTASAAAETNDDLDDVIQIEKLTFVLPNGKYEGKITDAFCYNKKKNVLPPPMRVMIKILLTDGNTLATTIGKDYLGKYPFSTLVQELGAKRIGDLKNAKVVFEVKNNTVNGRTYSNISRISLASV